MKIESIQPFSGQHCETTATGTLMDQLGRDGSEAMLFGLGEGLGFIYWKMKSMDGPFLGGRVKPMQLTRNLARNTKLDLVVRETTSVKKAWEQVAACIDEGQAVGLQLDCYHLEYFPEKIHFAGHVAAMVGYDDEFAYLVDTPAPGEILKTSLSSLADARSEKGPMSAKHLMYTLSETGDTLDLSQAIITAITNNAREHLNPPIKNLGYKGILKAGTELKKCFRQGIDLSLTAMLMEKAGTGGALFRNFYRDFLAEAYDITGQKSIRDAHAQFIDIASLWTEVAHLIEQADETRMNKAADLLKTLSEKEHAAMSRLSSLDDT